MNQEREFLHELSRTVIDMDNYPDFDFTSDAYKAVRLFRQMGIEVSSYRRDITGKNKIVFGRRTERTGKNIERVLDEGVEIEPAFFN